METINTAIDAVIVVTTAGIAFRMLYCIFLIKCNPDETPTYVKRMKHMMVFLILCFCIEAIKEAILKYYGG